MKAKKRTRATMKVVSLAASLGLISALSLTTSASAAPTSTFNWTQVTPGTSPSARSYAAMASDPAVSETVLFGGQGASGVLGDTWVWNGITWANPNVTGPSARSAASMAYDAKSNQLLLFGGRTGNDTPLADTWAWNGTSWSELHPATSPEARYGASMAYDATTQQVVLFGGDTVGAPLSDTWLWNGTTWTLSPATGPSIRHSAAMSFAPASGDVILFGGCRFHIFNQPCEATAVDGTLADTWAFNGTAWTEEHPTDSPSSRSAVVSATYLEDAVNAPVLFGGWDDTGTNFADTWVWNGTDWVQHTTMTSPPARHAHDMAYDFETGKLLLFGGEGASSALLNDTWDFADTVTPPMATTTTMTASPNPASVGQKVTLTATVSPTPDGGTVSFFDGTTPIPGCTHLDLFAGVATCDPFFTQGTHSLTAQYSGTPDFGPSTSTVVELAVGPPPNQGYWTVAGDGGVFSFGPAAQFFGSMGARGPLNKPVVGMASSPTGLGYWLVAADGGIFAFGDAPFLGSTGAMHLNKPVVGMTATPTGRGYWFVASDGGIFAFGDAGFFGSTGALTLNKPITGMASTPDGKGYWLVAQDGGVFAFGDAPFFGSMGGRPLNKPVVGMASTPDGKGYWLVASDGGIFAFGSAPFLGSTGAIVLNKPVVGMAPTLGVLGYWLDATDGGIFAFGDAPFFGSMGGKPLNAPMVGMASPGPTA